MRSEFLVIGSGIAGMFAALCLARSGQVNLVTKRSLDESNSYFAQGGVAVAIKEPDSPESHREDTLQAGAGLCDPGPVEVLVNEGPLRARELMELGVEFDHHGDEIALSKEGAHSYDRVIHAQGDSTGRAISKKLGELVRADDAIHIFEYHFVRELLVEDGRCWGAIVLDEEGGVTRVFRARATVLAAGGAGQLFAETSNPSTATGDGIALGYRAGADVRDIEFVQFHPTVLMADTGESRFLLSETLRGEGAVLVNSRGERFMQKYHRLGDLAPRDIVARAIWTEMYEAGVDHVYLDASEMREKDVEKRFPTIYSVCRDNGWDMKNDLLPVAPAAHYMMGGVKTSVTGATSIPGLFACGEVACTGVHGANRLASNSLLETVVFGKRAAAGASRYAASYARDLQFPASSGNVALDVGKGEDGEDAAGEDTNRLADARKQIQEVMWRRAGIVRCRESLMQAQTALSEIRSHIKGGSFSPAYGEVINMLDLADGLVQAALIREESRGAHYRSDFPTSRWEWCKHIILNKVRGVSFEERTG